jgi:hypothetical protein
MKILIYSKLIMLVLLILSGLSPGFAQCSTTTVFSENFDDNTVTSTSTTGGATAPHKLASLDAGQTKGDYAAACGGNIDISNNAEGCCSAGADTWKSNTTLEPGEFPTGNSGGTDADFALLVDGCGSVPDGSVWCTSITVAPGEIYDFSADYSSPWRQEKANDPALYLTINGVAISPAAIVEQYTATGPTPYLKQACYYTIPAGTSGVVDFCINMTQVSAGVYGVANGQGNDFSVDNIVINKRSGAGCPASGTCTYPGAIVAPVELLSYSGRVKSANTASLMWVTASEKNSSYFSIEKSDDATNFSEIGTVRAQGNSTNIVNYTFDDNHFNGSAYYRLKIVDLDGTYEYSDIQFLQSRHDYARIVKTESGELQVRATVKEDTQWNISVYTLLGQEYLSETLSVKKGENTLMKEFNAEDNSAKIIRIVNQEGAVILSQVFVW